MQPCPEAPEPSQYWAKTQLASLSERLTGWEPWYVETPFDPVGRYTWCARPEGAAIATCKGSQPAELITAVAQFEADLAAHIEATRQKLQRTPNATADAGRRNVLESQLTAMTRLHTRRQAEHQEKTSTTVKNFKSFLRGASPRQSPTGAKSSAPRQFCPFGRSQINVTPTSRRPRLPRTARQAHNPRAHLQKIGNPPASPPRRLDRRDSISVSPGLRHLNCCPVPAIQGQGNPYPWASRKPPPRSQAVVPTPGTPASSNAT